MLGVRGSCSIASCVTQPFVWRGSTRVLRRSFADSRAVYIVCMAARPSEARGHAGPARVPRSRFHLMLRGSQTAFDVAQLCGAGPRGSTHVLEEARERV